MSNSLRVSIVVATRNRCIALERCIKALEKQTYNQSLFEVIVVDDQSTSEEHLGNIQVIENSKLNISFKTLTESDRGTVIARNLALKHASGQIIAFLDDDSVPEMEWLKKITDYFDKYPEVSALTGRVEALELAHPLSVFRQNFYNQRYKKLVTSQSREAISFKFGIEAPKALHFADYLAGGNSAIRYNIIEQLGFFDPKFTMMHDKELAIRLLRKRFVCIYAPDVIIKHEHTKSVRDALLKSFWSGTMQYRLQRKHSGFIVPYYLNLLRPFNIIWTSRSLIAQIGLKFLALCFFIILLEWCHQFGYWISIFKYKNQQL